MKRLLLCIGFAALLLAQRPAGTGGSGGGGGGGASATQTICSGTIALGTTLIASGAKGSASTGSCTGLLTTDTIMVTFNGDPTGVTGFVPSTNGMLGLIVYPTANTVNVVQVNNTGASITPGATTVNYRATR